MDQERRRCYDLIQVFHCSKQGCDFDEVPQDDLFLCLESKVPILGERGHDETRIATGEMKAG
jgi:hypothetical protein